MPAAANFSSKLALNIISRLFLRISSLTFDAILDPVKNEVDPAKQSFQLYESRERSMLPNLSKGHFHPRNTNTNLSNNGDAGLSSLTKGSPSAFHEEHWLDVFIRCSNAPVFPHGGTPALSCSSAAHHNAHIYDTFKAESICRLIKYSLIGTCFFPETPSVCPNIR